VTWRLIIFDLQLLKNLLLFEYVDLLSVTCLKPSHTQRLCAKVSTVSQIRLKALLFATEPFFLCRRAYLRTGALLH